MVITENGLFLRVLAEHHRFPRESRRQPGEAAWPAVGSPHGPLPTHGDPCGSPQSTGPFFLRFFLSPALVESLGAPSPRFATRCINVLPKLSHPLIRERVVQAGSPAAPARQGILERRDRDMPPSVDRMPPVQKACGPVSGLLGPKSFRGGKIGRETCRNVAIACHPGPRSPRRSRSGDHRELSFFSAHFASAGRS